MSARTLLGHAAWALLLSATAASGAETVITLTGAVPDDGRLYRSVHFDVPAGIRELEVRHDAFTATTGNVLDFGVEGPGGVRGWGGGNTEPAVIAETAASRSYRPGSLEPGRWAVLIGSAKLATRPAQYRIEVRLRTAQTLAPQPRRRPYVHAPALERGLRWYVGDLHVHSRESGDARPPIDEVATFARAQGLDFVVLTDHNTVSQHDFLVDAQGRHPALLLVPGMELTTYAGHANAVGLTAYVDHRVEANDREGISAAAAAIAAQGAVFSVNHPAVDLGDRCIGCAWRQPLPEEHIHAVEIGTGGYNQSGFLYNEPAIALWDRLVANGFRVAAVGGSDDHRAGKDLSVIHSPIGSPTTLVLADELSVPAIVAALRAGRTVVKLQDGRDPMVDLRAGEARIGDTTDQQEVSLEVTVQGGAGARVRLLRNGVPVTEAQVDADPFKLVHKVTAPDLLRPDRYRAEVLINGKPRTITSHLFVGKASPGGGPRGGCGCSTSASLSGAAALVAAWLLRRQRPS